MMISRRFKSKKGTKESNVTSPNYHSLIPPNLLAKYNHSIRKARAHLVAARWLQKCQFDPKTTPIEYNILGIIALYAIQQIFHLENYDKHLVTLTNTPEGNHVLYFRQIARSRPLYNG